MISLQPQRGGRPRLLPRYSRLRFGRCGPRMAHFRAAARGGGDSSGRNERAAPTLSAVRRPAGDPRVAGGEEGRRQGSPRRAVGIGCLAGAARRRHACHLRAETCHCHSSPQVTRPCTARPQFPADAVNSVKKPRLFLCMEQTAPTEMTAVIRDEALLELADFDEVVRLYRPRIFRFLISSLGDRDTAESLTQDCSPRPGMRATSSGASRA